MRSGILGMRSEILEMRSGIRSGLLGMRSEILGMGSGITVEQFTIKPHILI
jgi:hypothetical protein